MMPSANRERRAGHLARKSTIAEAVIEIARQEGADFRSVRLTLKDDGAIRMDAQDIGPKATEFWGEDEYEFWMHVKPAALPKLAFELLREKFALAEPRQPHS